mgnify:CR=1 FL=1
MVRYEPSRHAVYLTSLKAYDLTVDGWMGIVKLGHGARLSSPVDASLVVSNNQAKALCWNALVQSNFTAHLELGTPSCLFS